MPAMQFGLSVENQFSRDAYHAALNLFKEVLMPVGSVAFHPR